MTDALMLREQSSRARECNLSVVVPVYNVEEYLDECLYSLVHQTLKNIEIIIIDDGSTDGCPEIAKDYANRYEFVEYRRIPNEGLGHARNYGAYLAKGKYIIFCDSDDIIPLSAYKKMFDFAEKIDCDFVTGDVIRFDSKTRYKSILHRRAFEDIPNVTHILESPSLVYDTTAWNKMFNRSFYEREHIRWAEGMLYEDIPTSIPAHFKAKRVGYIDEIVYRWRARDGANRSITQNRTGLSNFTDRMKAISMLLDFYEREGIDGEARFWLDRKLLSVDIVLYVDAMLNADDEYRATVARMLKEFLPRLRPDAFDAIRAIDRIKYFFIMRDDIESALQVIDYQKKGYKTLSIYKSRGEFYGRFPIKGIPQEQTRMTRELSEAGIWMKLTKASLTESSREVGFSAQALVSVPRLQMGPKHKVKLDACLVDSEGRRIPLKVKRKKSPKPIAIKTSRFYKAVRLVDQHRRLYEFSGALSQLDLQPGTYRIEMSYRQNGLVCKPCYLARPIPGWIVRPHSESFAGLKYQVGYDVNYHLIVRVSKLRRKVIDITPTDVPNLVVAHFEDGVQTAFTTRSISKIHRRYEFDSRCPIFVDAIDSYFAARRQSDGLIAISNFKSGVFTEAIQIDGLKLRIGVDTSMLSPRVSSDELIPLVKGVRYGAVASGRWGTREFGKAVIEFDFSDAGFTRLLREDTYVLELSLEGEGAVEAIRVRSGVSIDYKPLRFVDPGGYEYRVYATKRGVSIKSTRVLHWYEKTKRRKKAVEMLLYPALRALPIKKNLVVFESFWGASTDCNPGAFYRYLRKHHPEYECVWSLKDPRILGSENAKSVVRGTLPYFLLMSRAHYLFNNVNFMDAYEKKRGQIEVQTMHGTPLKTLGLDVKSDFPTQKSIDSFLRRCGRWDYLVVQSDTVAEITKSCYAFNRSFLRCGYPRNDALFAMNNEQCQSAMKEKLGIDPSKKLVLYSPTWRVSGRANIGLDLSKMLNELDEEWTVGLRLHHLAIPKGGVKGLDSRVKDLTNEKSIDDVLLAADVLITDYSSIMFDYGILGRPMLFYVYDLEDYRDKLRGFNIDLENEAPGPLLKTTEDVIECLSHIDAVEETYAADYKRFADKFLTYEEGNASERIFNEVFES